MAFCTITFQKLVLIFFKLQIAYGLRIPDTFLTLSSNNPNNFDAIEGLLYVPTLPPSANGSCADAFSTLPSNVTTLADFPTGQDYPLVAIFPWVSNSECVEAYFAQSRADAVRSVFTYQPNASQDLPDANSWNLGDDNRWKSDNQFPIYGIAASIGPQILYEMSLYSGNMTSAPNGDLLATQNDPRDFPRLFAHVDLQGGTNVPSLWIFLIIVLAILLGIVIIASIIMHLIQRHQRRVLQRRLARGEVDLESLGIKKMNVPQDKIDEMPKYTYTDGNTFTEIPMQPKSVGAQDSAAAHTASFSQSTCPICLDDFVANETVVRELPCKHIFHPECIDLFLRDNSSLCPMCKKSALPAGYCPVKVTNLMVRRERLVRRMRERRRQGVALAAARAAGDRLYPPSRTRRAFASLQTRFRQPTAAAPGVQAAQEDRVPQTETSAIGANSNNDVELGQVTQTAVPESEVLYNSNARRNTMAVPPEIAAQGAAARRAWRRERFARQQEQQYDEVANDARQADEGRPLWRRVVGRVAPGVA